ncbi:MAG: helix-turn-helix transcriptional regulator [bacterium]
MAPRKHSSSEINKIIGQKIFAARTLRGLSQLALGKRLGVSFQQMQKYEKGTNRLPLEALLRMMVVLDLPWEYFVSEAYDKARSALFAEEMPLLSSADGRALARAFAQVKSPARRKHIVALVREFAEASDKLPDAD